MALSKMSVQSYTGNLSRNLEILKAGGAVHVTTLSGSGKRASYYTCQYPTSVEGYDLVMMNDAPRGGKLGDYIASTKTGDKTIERAEFVRKFRRQWRDKLYQQSINSDDAIAKAAARAVNVVGRRRFENYGLTEKQYLTNITYNGDGQGLAGFHAQSDEGYRGCGVYRLAIKDGKITATLYGGFHDSCPYLVDKAEWVKAVTAELEKYGKVIKADGSGCQFFLRDSEDADLIAVKEYNVPAPNGDGNFGYAHRNIQIV